MRNQYKQKAYQLILDARVKLKHGEYIEHQDQIRIDINKISDTNEKHLILS